MGSREFLNWQIILGMDAEDEYERKWKQRERLEYYMANLAYELYIIQQTIGAIGGVKPNDGKKPEDFMIDFDGFSSPVPTVPENELPLETEEEWKQREWHSQNAWAAAFGIDPEMLRLPG